jgi:hypothetical protein
MVLFTPKPEGSVTFKRNSPMLLCAFEAEANASKPKLNKTGCFRIFRNEESMVPAVIGFRAHHFRLLGALTPIVDHASPA